jgi:16S rRNA (cytosine1402-N4)-methyltransferase
MHKTVLLRETVENLNLKPGMIVVDATLGAGGHSNLILEKIGEKGILIGLDLDQKAIDDFKKEIKDQKIKTKIFLFKENFINIPKILEELKIEKVDGIIADLGWRLDQVKNKEYGMSFQVDAPLDMRLGREGKLNAKIIVNLWDEQKLIEIFFKYGEERNSRKIARAIVEYRKNKKIETTKELEEIVVESVPFRKSRFNPATKVFQALRIAVNKELENLEKFLENSIEVLNSGGCLAVISFHSLEDRIVKRFFRANTGGCICPKELPICVCNQERKLKIINSKPITASKEELKENVRSRSAKLRIAEKC